MSHFRRLIAASLLCGAGLTVAPAAHSAPPVQQSEMFTKLAKRLSVSLGAEAVASVCEKIEGLDDGTKQSCKLVAEALGPIILEAANGSISPDDLVEKLRAMGQETLTAAVSVLGADWLANQLVDPLERALLARAQGPATARVAALPDAQHKELQQLRERAGEIFRCAAGSMLATRKAKKDLFSRCGVVSQLQSAEPYKTCFEKQQPKDIAFCLGEKVFAEALAALPLSDEERNRYAVGAAVIFTLVRDALEAFEGEGKQLLPKMASLIEKLDRGDDAAFTEPQDHEAFTDEAYAAEPAAGEALLTSVAETPSESACVKDLRESSSFLKRRALFERYQQAAMLGDIKRTAELAKATVAGLASCEGTKLSTEQTAAFAQWRQMVAIYSFMAEVSATTRALRIPAVFFAALIDQVRGNEQAIAAGLRLATSLALEQGIVDNDRRPWNCEEGTNELTCSELNPDGSETVHTIKARSGTTISEEELVYLRDILRARASAKAVRNTCIIMAGRAVLLDQRPTPHPRFGVVCRVLPDDPGAAQDVTDILYGSDVKLEELPDVEGATTLRKVTVASGASLPKALKMPARDVLTLMARAFAKVKGPNEKIEACLASFAERIQTMRNDEDIEAAVKAGAVLAMQLFEEPIALFVDRIFKIQDGGVCESKESMRCLTRSLVGLVLSPFIEAVLEGKSREEIARQTLRAVNKSEIFLRGPLFIDAGLGASVLYPLLSEPRSWDDPSLHLTVIDKWGWAICRGGPRSEWHVALFAGGFIDALVRTSGGGVDTAHVLLGATGGNREPFEGIPLGFDVHLAWAPPVDIATFQQNDLRPLLTVAGGVALTIPLDELVNDLD